MREFQSAHMAEDDDRDPVFRRNVLTTVGGITGLGITGIGAVTATSGRGNGSDSNSQNGGPPNDDGEDDEERTIEWKGQGAEHAEQSCSSDEAGYWKWILTPARSSDVPTDGPPNDQPGGPPDIGEVGELCVSFEDDTESLCRGRTARKWSLSIRGCQSRWWNH